MPKIIINTQSIKNRLRGYGDKPAESMLEYIWNGFDAGADNVRIDYLFPTKADGVSFGYPDLSITDDGFGWDIENIKATNLFLVSPKEASSDKSLPQGKDGVGRFTFYSFAKKATWETVAKDRKYRLILETDSLDDYKLEKECSNITISKGTKVSFNVFSDRLTEDFFNIDLVKAIKLEFCWFFKLYPQKSIFLNGNKISEDDMISKEQKVSIDIEGYAFELDLIQWILKPTREFSKYYFIDKKGREAFAKTTGLNYQSDEFHHSAYVISNFFNQVKNKTDFAEDDKNALPLETEKQKLNKKIFKELSDEIKKRLELMRKPFLRKLSRIRIDEWKTEKILPDVEQYGLDQGEYEKIVEEIYVAAPQLFKNGNDEQRKVLLRFFSSLLVSEERDDLLKILDQVFKLSSEDKKTLSGLLERTTLSKITHTIKEIDDRLNVLTVLEEILFDRDKSKYTREVDHLQKILDANFWIFGENYRLFSSTEGSIKNTLVKFKNEILRKEDEEVKTKSRKELDLFLTKSEQTSGELRNIIIEIKRPSVKLGKKELDQIKSYMETILKEASCNGSKIIWVFYLIGCDYDDYIKGEINTNKGWGEKSNGLAFYNEERDAKLYVKKWSDIINVEQKSRYKYLQDKLNVELKKTDGKNVDEVVDGVLKNKK
jgi:hypothetical protein